MSEITPQERIYQMAKAKVEKRWGPQAFEAIGPAFRRAVVAEAVMAIACGQDASVDGNAVRRIIDHAWDRINDDFPGV